MVQGADNMPVETVSTRFNAKALYYRAKARQSFTYAASGLFIAGSVFLGGDSAMHTYIIEILPTALALKALYSGWQHRQKYRQALNNPNVSDDEIKKDDENSSEIIRTGGERNYMAMYLKTKASFHTINAVIFTSLTALGIIVLASDAGSRRIEAAPIGAGLAGGIYWSLHRRRKFLKAAEQASHFRYIYTPTLPKPAV